MARTEEYDRSQRSMAFTVHPQPTPNPNAVRFALSSPLLGDKSRTFSNAAAAKGTPWAESLFALPGVASLFGMKDFLTITKRPDASWDGIVGPATKILERDLAAS
jgi:hypothetical protein